MTPLDRALAVLTPQDDPSKALVATKCRALMIGYASRWSGTKAIAVQAVEDLVTSDLWNPETRRTSRSFTIAAKIDVRYIQDGRLMLMDHKTCSEDITDPNATYWRQLAIEGQVTHYMLLEWLNARKVDMAVWDVVRKPSIRPKQLTKKEIQSAIFGREYYGRAVTDADVEEIQHTNAETLGMYEARLIHDCTVERPQWYFQRRPVPRLDHELVEYASELWEHGQEILHVRNTGRHVRNSGACMMYGSPCKYLGVCSGHDDVDSANWTRKNQVHVELPTLEGDGRDVITNSRIRSFQTCRRKHYYDYELGVERVDEEERETLFFGTLWHEALEAFFLAQMEAKHGDGSTRVSDSESDTSNVSKEVLA